MLRVYVLPCTGKNYATKEYANISDIRGLQRQEGYSRWHCQEGRRGQRPSSSYISGLRRDDAAATSVSLGRGERRRYRLGRQEPQGHSAIFGPVARRRFARRWLPPDPDLAAHENRAMEVLIK